MPADTKSFTVAVMNGPAAPAAPPARAAKALILSAMLGCLPSPAVAAAGVCSPLAEIEEPSVDAPLAFVVAAVAWGAASARRFAFACDIQSSHRDFACWASAGEAGLLSTNTFAFAIVCALGCISGSDAAASVSMRYLVLPSLRL
jgi:hypothetical protein